MKIKFLDTDPRAGTVAQMDSSRGQQLIDAGAAVQVDDRETSDESASVAATASTEGAPLANSPAKVKKTAAKAKD